MDLVNWKLGSFLLFRCVVHLELSHFSLPSKYSEVKEIQRCGVRVLAFDVNRSARGVQYSASLPPPLCTGNQTQRLLSQDIPKKNGVLFPHCWCWIPTAGELLLCGSRDSKKVFTFLMIISPE